MAFGDTSKLEEQIKQLSTQIDELNKQMRILISIQFGMFKMQSGVYDPQAIVAELTQKIRDAK